VSVTVLGKGRKKIAFGLLIREERRGEMLRIYIY